MLSKLKVGIMIRRGKFLAILLAATLMSAADNQDEIATLQSNKAFLDLFENLDAIQDVREKQFAIDKEIVNLNNLQIEKDYNTVKLQNIIFVKIHQHIPHTILLPNDFQVQSVLATPNDNSVLVTVDEQGKNVIDIVATPQMYKTNLRVTYKDGKSQSYIMNIFAERYEANSDDSKIFLGTKIFKNNLMKDSEVLSLFFDKNGRLPQNNEDIRVGNTNHIFVEDAKNGTILINNSKFKIVRK